MDDTTFEVEVEQPGLNSTVLLQTNDLLIIVLAVCFATLGSIAAVCLYFLRRHCKKRGAAQPQSELDRTCFLSKATSVTGLNAVNGYYSTKVEKKDHDSPLDYEKLNTSCQLSTGQIVEGTPLISRSSSDLAPLSTECQVPLRDATPIHFKMANVHLSTPITLKAMCAEEGVDDRSTPHGADQPEQRLSMADCIETSPSTNSSSAHMQKLHPSMQEEFFNGDATKGPSTQSVSWFVSLTGGIQREPLRHSVVGLSLGEIDIEVQNSRNSQRNQQQDRGIKLEVQQLRCEDTRSKENGEREDLPASMKSALERRHADSVAENVLPANDKNCVSTHNSTSRPFLLKRTQWKPEKFDGNYIDKGINSDCRRRSRSPSSSTAWKQREERPVLFLGSGIK